MLLGLHVKNLALIEKAEVEFTGGLNILTGETGAGKSILIGSVGLALGGKASKDMIRQGEDSALVELAFSVDDEKKKNALEALDIAPDEDGLLIISKKITPSRTVSRINDETVTTARLKAVTGLSWTFMDSMSISPFSISRSIWRSWTNIPGMKRKI